MAEKVGANGGDDLLTGLLQNDGLDIGGDEGNEKDTAVNGYDREKPRHFKVLGDHFLDLTDEKGRGEVKGFELIEMCRSGAIAMERGSVAYDI